MLHKPAFRACFHVERIDSYGVLLLSERGFSIVQGQAVEHLAPFLDGRHTVEEIVARCEGLLSEATIVQTLLRLEQKGFIAEAEAEVSEEHIFWNTAHVVLGPTAPPQTGGAVSVTALGPLRAETLEALLQNLGIAQATDSLLKVVLAESYLHEALAAFNRQALARQRPWMLVKPVGTIVWIGPLFIPGKTGCWECLARRLRTNLADEFLCRRRGEKIRSLSALVGALPSTVQTALSLAATEIAKWVRRGTNKDIEGKLLDFDTLTLELQHHRLLRDPLCPACGEPRSPGLPQALLLHPRQKRYTMDGGHRSISPEDTLRRYEHMVSPITGMLRHLVEISPSGNPHLHVYAARFNSAYEPDGLTLLRRNDLGTSWGKGSTPAQARASALCEALERLSGLYRGDEPCVVSSYQALGSRAIHPNACMLFSAAQYESRQDRPARLPGLRIPEPFDETRPIAWTPLWSLTDATFKHLPTAYCYFNGPAPGRAFCHTDSNGHAAGNTLEEAILQGFFEVVERDSVALWWYNHLQMPGVALEGFNDPYFTALLAQYRTLNRDLCVLDITSDLDLPTFVALSRGLDDPGDVRFGFGAHLDARLGIQRALTELNQWLPAITGQTSARSPQITPVDDDHRLEALLGEHALLTPHPGFPAKTLEDYPMGWTDDLLEDILLCKDIIESKGMDLLVLDQTRADLGMPVVKVVVPGLRHYKRRTAAGRLFDVPVDLGRLSQPLTEQQLNPLTLTR